jgi:hypothetical protein
MGNGKPIGNDRGRDGNGKGATVTDTGNPFITIRVFSSGSSGRHRLLAGQVGRNLSGIDLER